MMDEKFINFEFTLSERVPTEVALEIVALRQAILMLTAALPQDTRNNVVNNLAKVDSPQMRDIVKNMRLIDAD
ncbi:hypothetical protein N7V53_01495 [Kosakonia sp. HypNH10]|uniref:hypothetical protein n=1 Tax=Kosakonia TaxID=1330547 RepID=UPI00244856EE|nr:MULTISPECIES: hypothetical protein [Kosakonia]MDH2911212.1 hypothetical protein [Kosakonia sp. HypNH10]